MREEWIRWNNYYTMIHETYNNMWQHNTNCGIRDGTWYKPSQRWRRCSLSVAPQCQCSAHSLAASTSASSPASACSGCCATSDTIPTIIIHSTMLMTYDTQTCLGQKNKCMDRTEASCSHNRERQNHLIKLHAESYLSGELIGIDRVIRWFHCCWLPCILCCVQLHSLLQRHHDHLACRRVVSATPTVMSAWQYCVSRRCRPCELRTTNNWWWRHVHRQHVNREVGKKICTSRSFWKLLEFALAAAAHTVQS